MYRKRYYEKTQVRIALEAALPDLKEEEKLTYYLKEGECPKGAYRRIANALQNMAREYNTGSYKKAFGVVLRTDRVNRMVHILKPCSDEVFEKPVSLVRSEYRPNCY